MIAEQRALSALAVLVEWIANVDGAPAPSWITDSRPYLDACELLRDEGILRVGEGWTAGGTDTPC